MKNILILFFLLPLTVLAQSIQRNSATTNVVPWVPLAITNLEPNATVGNVFSVSNQVSGASGASLQFENFIGGTPYTNNILGGIAGFQFYNTGNGNFANIQGANFQGTNFTSLNGGQFTGNGGGLTNLNAATNAYGLKTPNNNDSFSLPGGGQFSFSSISSVGVKTFYTNAYGDGAPYQSTNLVISDYNGFRFLDANSLNPLPINNIISSPTNFNWTGMDGYTSIAGDDNAGTITFSAGNGVSFNGTQIIPNGGIQDLYGQFGQAGQVFIATGGANQNGVWTNYNGANLSGGAVTNAINTSGSVTANTFNGNGGGLTALLNTNKYACTIATNIIVYTVPSGVTNTYEVGGFINTTAAVTDTTQMKVTFTDENNASQTDGMSAVLTGTGFNSVSSQTIMARGGTTITIQVPLPTSSGSITYDAGAWIQQR